MEKYLIIILAAFFFLPSDSSLHVQEKSSRKKRTGITYEFKNGNWFTGKGFLLNDFYSVDGVLTSERPGRIDSTIDLKDKYLIPPFAEAHTHNIGFPPTEIEMRPYIKSGIFYVMVQSNTYPRRNGQVEGRTVVNVIDAGVLITPSGSHITAINERSADRGNFPGLTKKDLDGKTHLIVDSKDDLAKLDKYLSGKPKFIKIILAFSEEYEKRKNDPNYIGKRGIDPSLVHLIVKEAHRRNIKVSAHIETAEDFRTAVRGGVDIIAHLPGSRIGNNAGFTDTLTTRWLLTKNDALQAVKKKVTVITTVTASKILLNPTKSSYPVVFHIHKQNLGLLFANGVKLVVGSDYYEGNSVVEAVLLGKQDLLGNGIKSLGIFSNLDLINLWCTQTPRFIFPDRNIGELKAGYEASFLVLDGNPIDDLSYALKIKRIYIQGEFIGAN